MMELFRKQPWTRFNGHLHGHRPQSQCRSGGGTGQRSDAGGQLCDSLPHRGIRAQAMLSAIMSRVTQRIAGSLARELKELPEKVEQAQMAAAVQGLFHLQTAEPALGGSRF